MNRKFIKITIILAVVLILFLVGKEKGWFKRKPAGSTGSENSDESTPVTPTTTTGTGTGSTGTGNTGTTTRPPSNTGNTGTIPAHFDPKEQATKLKNLLNDWWDAQNQDEQAFDIVLSYTDAQIKAVDKAWREMFLVVNGNPSLYRLIDTEVVLGRASVAAKKLKCLQKLKALGLDKRS